MCSTYKEGGEEKETNKNRTEGGSCEWTNRRLEYESSNIKPINYKINNKNKKKSENNYL
jgi:hypothetical protein